MPTTVAGAGGVVVVACVGLDNIPRPAPLDGVVPADASLAAAVAAAGALSADDISEQGLTVAWSEPVEARVDRVGGEVIIDLPGSVRDVVVSSPFNSGPFTIPLAGTAFLDPTVERVTITLDGSAEGAAQWWEASQLTWTREQWEGIYG